MSPHPPFLSAIRGFIPFQYWVPPPLPFSDPLTVGRLFVGLHVGLYPSPPAGDITEGQGYLIPGIIELDTECYTKWLPLQQIQYPERRQTLTMTLRVKLN